MIMNFKNMLNSYAFDKASEFLFGLFVAVAVVAAMTVQSMDPAVVIEDPKPALVAVTAASSRVALVMIVQQITKVLGKMQKTLPGG